MNPKSSLFSCPFYYLCSQCPVLYPKWQDLRPLSSEILSNLEVKLSTVFRSYYVPVHVCLYVCIYIYTHTCMCIYIYTRTYILIYIYAHAHDILYANTHAHIETCSYAEVHRFRHLHIVQETTECKCKPWNQYSLMFRSRQRRCYSIRSLFPSLSIEDLGVVSKVGRRILPKHQLVGRIHWITA